MRDGPAWRLTVETTAFVMPSERQDELVLVEGLVLGRFGPGRVSRDPGRRILVYLDSEDEARDLERELASLVEEQDLWLVVSLEQLGGSKGRRSRTPSRREERTRSRMDQDAFTGALSTWALAEWQVVARFPTVRDARELVDRLVEHDVAAVSWRKRVRVPAESAEAAREIAERIWSEATPGTIVEVARVSLFRQLVGHGPPEAAG